MKAARFGAETEGDDFNDILDSILDILSCELKDTDSDAVCRNNASTLGSNDCVREYTTEDEYLLRAEETYSRLTANAREIDAKRANWELAPIPKIMKNDIRRYYSRMFMNTLNSADFTKLQNYFNTFMSRSCTFVAEHAVHPEFSIPTLMVADGPRIKAHYTLGCFVMYPDMVLSMSDSNIVTSNCWAGTKIVMDVQINATKMYEIDFETWIPRLADLTERYEAALRDSSQDNAIASYCETSATRSTITLESVKADCGCGSAAHLCECDDNGLASYTDIGPSDIGQQISRNSEHTMHSSPTHSTTTPPLPSQSSKCANQGTMECAAAALGARYKRKIDETEDELCLTNIDAHSVPTWKDEKDSYIPETYIRSLFARAKVLPVPIPLQMQGQITMYLDESNHIQHMHLKMEQKNK